VSPLSLSAWRGRALHVAIVGVPLILEGEVAGIEDLPGHRGEASRALGALSRCACGN